MVVGGPAELGNSVKDGLHRRPSAPREIDFSSHRPAMIGTLALGDVGVEMAQTRWEAARESVALRPDRSLGFELGNASKLHDSKEHTEGRVRVLEGLPALETHRLL